MTKRKVGVVKYFLLGLAVAILTMLVLIPFNIAMAVLSLTGNILMLVAVLIVYFPLAFTISGWVIAKVVEWKYFGWKRKK